MQVINGSFFKQMLTNALNNLYSSESEINRMNVFPVPDGDTGTNMLMTLENGLNGSPDTDDLSVFLESLSRGMLYGARGNSGVILSQIFKGISNSLSGKAEMTPKDFAVALKEGARNAYLAVMNPVEGTILTVVLESSDFILRKVDELPCFEDFFSLYLGKIRESLDNTPNLMALLAEANVVDSGGYGFLKIMEGAGGFLLGNRISRVTDNPDHRAVSNPLDSLDLDSFTADTVFEYGYCMEFILQLLNSRTDVQSFDFESFRVFLSEQGESLVFIPDGSRIKVHVHTLRPAPIITYAQQFGEFLSFKLENMCLQHNEYIRSVQKTISAPFVAVVVCDRNLFPQFKPFPFVSCIDSHDTQSIPVSEFIERFNCIDAQKIAVFPNSKNAKEAALQAVSIAGRDNIEIIDSDSVVKAFYAITMSSIEDENPEAWIDELRETVRQVVSIRISRSTKNCIIDGVRCTQGQYVAYVAGKISCCCESLAECAVKAVGSISDLEDRETAFVFHKEDADIDALIDELSSAYDGIGFSPIEGCQENCDLMMGIV